MTKEDLSISGEITIDDVDYFIVYSSGYYIPIPKGVIQKTKIKLIDINGNYSGQKTTIIDSIIINTKTNTITFWNDGNIFHKGIIK